MTRLLAAVALLLPAALWAQPAPLLIKRSDKPTFTAPGLSLVDLITKSSSPGVSVARASLNGPHGPTLNRRSDRIYYILDGKARIEAGGRSFSVGPGDCVFIPRNVPHFLDGKIDYLVINAPAFDFRDEKDLSKPAAPR